MNLHLLSLLGGRLLVALVTLLIVSFVVLTTPVTLMMLGQSALYRDRFEGEHDVPSKPSGEPADPEI